MSKQLSLIALQIMSSSSRSWNTGSYVKKAEAKIQKCSCATVLTTKYNYCT